MKRSLMINLIVLFLTTILFLGVLEIVIRFAYGSRQKFLVDDELYWKNKPNQVGFPEIGLQASSINSHGFRGEEINLSLCNILVFGDSFTFGYGVRDNETYSYLLDDLIGQKTEVINAGVSGYGLFQEYILFNRIYERYNPDGVII